jgi:CRP-like cAMP-binding protein
MTDGTAAQNRLIDCLPGKDRRALLARCELVHLAHGRALSAPGKPLRDAYFPVDACVSVLLPIHGTRTLEVGLVGNEGMLGSPMVLGVARVPWQALVQGPGTAWRIAASALRAELIRSAALRRVLQRYLYVLMSQLAGAVACMHFHEIGPRLARRLLMGQDGARGAHFHVTHAGLADMLGVRRVGITAAATALQRGGLIEYHRGDMHVRDRPGLEAAACACYGDDRRAYAEMLG